MHIYALYSIYSNHVPLTPYLSPVGSHLYAQRIRVIYFSMYVSQSASP